jgi:F0F1-type ATP synthase epsilon subunit
MAQRLTLTVLTPESSLLWVDSARKVRVKLEDGAWLSVYPHHAPLVGTMLPGPLYYEVDVALENPGAGFETRTIALSGGILRVADNDIVILTHGPLSPELATGDGDEDVRAFDRLARQLMVSLGAESVGVLAHPDDSS